MFGLAMVYEIFSFVYDIFLEMKMQQEKKK